MNAQFLTATFNIWLHAALKTCEVSAQQKNVDLKTTFSLGWQNI